MVVQNYVLLECSDRNKVHINIARYGAISQLSLNLLILALTWNLEDSRNIRFAQDSQMQTMTIWNMSVKSRLICQHTKTN